ncbi:hypothetical protein [Roseococcus sp. YIM B11640]|uniref:hypothetical protein n=1 Tax=Roseococcus sp. YIM B11640 TaxID=3133973 RepID=UPI003C7E294E
MSSASDRLAALTNASFEDGGHRAAFVPALHDVSTVGNEVAVKAAEADADAAAADAARILAQSYRDATLVARDAAMAAIQGATVAQPVVPLIGVTSKHAGLTFARGSAAVLVEPPSGAVTAITEVASGVPRYDATYGLLLEPASQNVVTNPRNEGGTPGSPGSYPTGFGALGSQGGMTRTLAYNSLLGMTMLSVQLAGTASNSTPTVVEATVRNASPAATGLQNRVASAYLRIRAGAITNVATIRLRALALNSGGAAVGSQISGANQVSLLDGSLRRVVLPYQLANDGTIARVVIGVEITTTNGQTSDITLDIWGTQDEPDMLNPTSIMLPVVGTPGVSSSARDTLSGALSGLGLDTSGLTITGRCLMPNSAPTGADQQILQIDGGSDASAFGLRNPAGATSLLGSRANSGGQNTASLGTLVPGTEFKWGITINRLTGEARFCINGGSVLSVTGGPVSGLTTLRFGGRVSAHTLNGYLSNANGRPYFVNDNTGFAALVAAA